MARKTERRKWARFPVDVHARLQWGLPPQDLSSRITNASRGGMFVPMAAPAAIGTHLIIEIPSSQRRRSLVVAGRVVRRIVPARGTPEAGVGIEVTATSAEWTEFCSRFTGAGGTPTAQTS